MPGGAPSAQAAFLDAQDRLAAATAARDLPEQRRATAALRAAYVVFMTNAIKSIPGSLIYLAILIGAPFLSVIWLPGVAATLPFYFTVIALIFLSFITAFSIIAIRTQVRLTRVRLIDLFAQTFSLERGGNGPVNFEFVRGKYFVDLHGDPEKLSIDDIPRFPLLLHADWMLLFCAIPYMVFSGFGMFLIFPPEAFLHVDHTVWAWLRPSLLLVGRAGEAILADPARLDAYHVNLLTIAGLAFAGAYFFTLRLLLRAVVVFDLSTVTFLRAFAIWCFPSFLRLSSIG